jgi:hypothetical protein
VDDDAFVGTSSTHQLANPNLSARKATDVGLVLNWYLSRNIKVQLNYEETKFDGGAAGGPTGTTNAFCSPGSRLPTERCRRSNPGQPT